MGFDIESFDCALVSSSGLLPKILLPPLSPKSGEVPKENEGAFGGREGGCLDTSCCAVGTFVVDDVKGLPSLCLPVSAVAGNTNFGVCSVPKRLGFSVSVAPGLKMDDNCVGGDEKLRGVGFPKVPVEAKEVPLDVGNLKGIEVGLNGLAFGSSLVKSLLVLAVCSGVADRGFSLFCSSSEFSTKRGS